MLGPGLVLAVAPKCPLCVAAYLSLFGAGAAAAIAPWVRPGALGLIVVLAIASVASAVYRRRHRRLASWRNNAR
ncbi:MAG: hypothetical protein WKG01_14685 [Kofleriaceae bacterium]